MRAEFWSVGAAPGCDLKLGREIRVRERRSGLICECMFKKEEGKVSAFILIMPLHFRKNHKSIITLITRHISACWQTLVAIFFRLFILFINVLTKNPILNKKIYFSTLLTLNSVSSFVKQF